MNEEAQRRIRENIEKHQRGEDASSLYLGSCELTEVPDLSGLPWLTALNLRDNEIRDGRFFEKLTSLTSLNLSFNRITDWRFLKKLTSLTTLNLSSNQISDGRFLEKLTSLTTLDLSSNQISDYYFLEKLINLTSLHVGGSRISDVQFLEKLTNLTSLHLSSNQISDKRVLEKLTNLTSLSLRKNQISDVQFLENLINLTSLDLSLNKITNVLFLENLTVLNKLDLGGNQISDVRSLGNLTNLTFLSLKNNQISDVQSLGNLTNLKSLILGSNQISDVRFLKNLTELTKLDLGSNQISDVQFLENMMYLHWLDLSSNQISDVQFLKNLTRVYSLSLGSNQITDLTPVVPFIKKGVKITQKGWAANNEFNFKDCPLAHPPVEIVKQGNEAILNYFAQLEKAGESELLEAKAILIGEGMAGKTSLRNRLLGRNLPNKPDRTKGLDVEIDPYRFPLADGKTMQLNLFDFGGQDHYKPLHQFFYSKRSLYLLLTRNGDDQNDFDFWLDTAQLHGDNSPMLVVNNLFGDVKSNFDAKKWASNYSFLKESLEVNLDTLTGFEALKSKIEGYAAMLPHIRQVVPKSWAAIRETLKTQSATENYIDLKDYLKICAENGIEEEESALFLSRYLHDIGVFLHYQDNDSLVKWVILKNDWATEAVYRVLDDKEIAAAKGHFTREDLQRVWQASEYKFMRDALFELMREFRLCYPKPDGKGFIAPALLPTEAAHYDWPADPDERQMRVEYKFMPRVLLTQFIVAEHEKIENGRLCVWRGGAVFFKGAARVEVRQSGKNALEFRAQGPGKVDFMTILNDTLESLHAQTPGVVVDWKIPCICEKCRKGQGKPHLFEKSRLDNRLDNGKRLDECQNSFQEFEIEDLLGRVLNKKTPGRRPMGEREELLEVVERRPLKAFVSSSEHDIEWLGAFKNHLSALSHSNLIETRDDFNIEPGKEKDREIGAAIDNADIVFLLASASFLATPSIWKGKIKKAMERHERGEAIVVPIKVKPCDWTGTPLDKLQGLLRNGQAISTAPDQDEAWTSVVAEIRHLIEDFWKK